MAADAVENELSRAVAIYLGYGAQAAPVRDLEALKAAFGADKAVALEQAVDDLIREIGSIDVDWSRESLASAARTAGELLSSRHPELSPRAIAALEWKLAWDWR